MTTELRGVPGRCFDIDGDWWNGHGPGSGCRDCDSPAVAARDPLATLWADLEAESRRPGGTMTITKAQYGLLLALRVVGQEREPHRAMFVAMLPRLRRIARAAQNTYVGRNWPSMEDMRKDGIGHGLIEDRAHERFIRRYLDTFQPEFMVDLLDAIDAPR